MKTVRAWSGVLMLAGVCVATPAMADDFDEWRREQGTAFDDWRAEQDRAFAEMLERDWRAFERFRGLRRDPEPKPPRPPRITASTDVVDEPPSSAAPAEPDASAFLGHPLRPPAEWDASAAAGVEPDPEQVAAAYRALLAADPSGLVEWLRARSEEWRLGDWGEVKLVRAVVDGMDASRRAEPLLAWFLLLQLDHDVRIGYGERGFAVLLSARQKVYERAYYEVEGQRYYDVFDHGGGERLFSHAGQHAAVDAPDLAPRRHPRTRPEPATAVLESTEHRMPLEYDRRLARYYRDHPQLDLEHFLGTPLDTRLAESASRYWREQGLSERPALEQVNLLLAMVQRLPYETDQDQFGTEKYMLPEEVFTHPASDCDDRTLLFSSLVQHLVGVDHVSLLYPGHVAAAVEVDGEGDRWRIGGRSYLVADPTYVGATAGMTMPQYEGQAPDVAGS